MTAYWAIGVPLSWFIGIHLNKGLPGIWAGPNAASLFLMIVYYIVVSCLNWQKLFVEVKERKIQANKRVKEMIAAEKEKDGYTKEEELSEEEWAKLMKAWYPQSDKWNPKKVTETTCETDEN